MDTSQKKLWSYIKSQRKDNSGIPPLSQNGTVHTDQPQKAEILNNYFSSVFRDKKSAPPTLEESLISDIAPITIDMHGVKNLLDNSQSHWPRQYTYTPTETTQPRALSNPHIDFSSLSTTMPSTSRLENS